MHKNRRASTILLFVILLPIYSVAADQAGKKISIEDFIRANVASKKEIDVFLREMSWAQFDPVVGYILGNYMPRDGSWWGRREEPFVFPPTKTCGFGCSMQ